jgi:hypothetical protein
MYLPKMYISATSVTMRRLNYQLSFVQVDTLDDVSDGRFAQVQAGYSRRSRKA